MNSKEVHDLVNQHYNNNYEDEYGYIYEKASFLYYQKYGMILSIG